MAKTYIAKGDVLTLVAPTGGVTAGTPVLIGNLVVIPQETVAETLSFDAYVTGCHSMPKATSVNWVQGAILYWDNSAKKVTNVSTSNYRLGASMAAALDADTTVNVRLNGQAVPSGA